MKVIIDNEIKDYQSIWMTKDNTICAIDQRKLPFSFEIFECINIQEVCFAIKDMVVRGAPLIGIAAAYGLLQNISTFTGENYSDFKKHINNICDQLTQTRPTAVDLFNILNQIKCILNPNLSISENIESIKKEIQIITNDILNECYKIGKIGNDIIPPKSTIMTICNAGALATLDYGTALAPIREAKKEEKEITVFVCETRPRLQGGRLTAWELQNEGIEHFIISDNAAGYYLNKGKIDLVITGADRIALNGDTANKIGTYTLSVLCKENNVPFYIAAPNSTFDYTTKSGEEIIIEERDSLEVSSVLSVIDEKDKKPKRRFIHNFNSKNLNPAFDITPNENITGILTPKEIIYPPYEKTIQKLKKN